MKKGKKELHTWRSKSSFQLKYCQMETSVGDVEHTRFCEKQKQTKRPLLFLLPNRSTTAHGVCRRRLSWMRIFKIENKKTNKKNFFLHYSKGLKKKFTSKKVVN